MTKVRIDPGICGLKTLVSAQAQDETSVTVKISSACSSIVNDERRRRFCSS